MIAMRYVLSGLFVISVAVGLLLLVRAETGRVAGASQKATNLAGRPALWFGGAATLFAAIVVLTLLFPVGD